MEQNMTHPRRRRQRKKSQLPGIILVVLIALVVIGGLAALIVGLSANFILTLRGESLIEVEYGQEFVDPGVDATYRGELREDVQIETQQVTLDGLGDFIITYTASYRGHRAEVKRTVRVVDTQKPVISLVYNSNSFTLPGQPYVEEGYGAEDNYDGDITHLVERIVDGDQIIYRVKDSSGNVAQVTRTIKYGDATPPELTLLGDEKITIKAGTAFQDPGYTATDNADGDLTAKVTVSKDHDIYTPGTYTITYTVTDSFGNTATATRTLVVEKASQSETVIPGEKVIYLTFDDGPSKYTAELLQILAKYNVKATFFVVGTAATSYLDDIVDQGHAIAIHTMTHDYASIYASKEAYFDDLYAMQKLIQDKTGVLTTLMRFPGGSSNMVSKKYCPGIMTELTQAVEAQGFQYFDWNVDSHDASDAKTEDEVFNNVINGVRNKRYSIVLQHDIKGYSVKAVDRIIEWGLANGYTFKPLDPTSPTAHHGVNN